MADLPVSSLSRARELKITELSTFFANDDLSLEDLERRIERVYKAGSLAELDAITSDLTSAPSTPAAEPGIRLARASQPSAVAYTVESARVLSLLSSTRRVGRWSVPQQLDVVAVMSDTRIDMTHAVLPSGIIDLELRCVMASFKLIVPPSVRVINETHAVMANVESRADEVAASDTAPSRGPIVRLTGYAFMSEVKVVVRRLEDPYTDDDDDD